MNIMKLAIAAAVAIGTPAVAFASAPAGASTLTSASADAAATKGDAVKRPRVTTRRVCTTVTRHHHRQRVCRMVRVRR
jgi:hypothetical protein